MSIVVTGGVHGDEPSGDRVLGELAGDGFETLGSCNPWGLDHDTRTLEDGRDLNRVFAAADCDEAERVRGFLKQQQPKLLLDLHEDCDVEEAYLIQVAPGIDLGRKIVDRLADRYPFKRRPHFGPVYGRDGLIHPTGWMLQCQRLSRRWSLTFYAWLRHQCPAFVVEAPSSWPLAQRLRFHQDVCKVAAELYQASTLTPARAIAS